MTTFEAILAIENAGERKKKLDREKNEFFISGLPPEIQFSVRNAITDRESISTENLRVIAENALRSPIRKKKSRQCYYCEEDYTPGHRCKNREPRRSERLQRKNLNQPKKEEKEVHNTRTTEDETEETNVHETEVHTNEDLAESIQFVKIRLNNSEEHALIDSGSSINILSESLAKKINAKIIQRNNIIINKFSSKVTAKGIAKVCVEDKEELTFIIVEDKYPRCIASQPALRAWQARADWTNNSIVINGQRKPMIPKEELRLEVHTTGQSLTQDQKSAIQDIIVEFETVFTPVEKYLDNGPTEFRIKLRDDEPCREPPRRRPRWKEEILEDLVNGDVKRGILEPCRETDYVSEPVLVPKENGAWRLCIDYRKINAKTITDPHPLPRIDAIIDMMSDKRYFSKIDCERGYHQLRIKPEDRPKTAFRTAKGIYSNTSVFQWALRMPRRFSNEKWKGH